MKIAITGSNGFIGKHLKEMLINMNYQIVTISNKKNFENKIENYTFDEFFLGNLRISFDCILHLVPIMIL